MNKQKAKAKPQSTQNTKKTLFAPKISKTVMNGLRENLLSLNQEGSVSPKTAEGQSRSKHIYMLLANTAIQQCGVSSASFSSACDCKEQGEKEKFFKIFSSMSTLRQLENTDVNGKDGAEKFEKALNDVIALTSGDGKSRFPNIEFDILKRTDPQADKECFFVLSMAMVTARIRQLYEKNLANGIITASSQGGDTGVYSFQYNINSLHDMLQDIADGFIAIHPPKADEPIASPSVEIVNDAGLDAEQTNTEVTVADLPEEEPEIVPKEVSEKIKKIQEGCRNYIMTAKFEGGEETPEGWYLAPFVDSVVEMLIAKNVVFATSGNVGILFQHHVNDINNRVALAFSSISSIMKQSLQEHGYLKDEKIGSMVSAQIGKILNSNSDVIKPENDDIKDKDGALSDGNTTKKIKESLENITQNIDKKMNDFYKTAQSNLPMLELCRANIQSSPVLLNIALAVEDGDDFYFRAKDYLVQADKNIEVIISIVDKDTDVAGEVDFIRQLIEIVGAELFTASATAIRKTAVFILNNLKEKYKTKSDKFGKSGKLVSEKIKEKFGDNKYFSQEMHRRMMSLMPKIMSGEEEDKQIEILAANKKRNEEFLKKKPTNWMPDFTKEDDKPYYQNEFISIAQRYLPLDESAFQAGIRHAIAMAKEIDIDALRQKPESVEEVVKTETPEEKKKKEADDARRAFNKNNKEAILEQAGDYSENLFVGFSDKALRLNDDKGEAATDRDIRLKTTTKKMEGKVDEGVLGLINYVDIFLFGTSGGTDKEILNKYILYLKGEGAKNAFSKLEKENLYRYYGNEKYRIQIEQMMGDDFGLLHRKPFENELIAVCVKIGKALAKKKLTTTLGGEAAKNERSKVANVSHTVKNHIADISAYDNGRLNLLTPYLTNNDEIFQAISGTDVEYDIFYQDKLPIIANRMNAIYDVFTDSRIYFIAMTLKMKLKNQSNKHKNVADLILDISKKSENEEEETIGLINAYAKRLSKAQVTQKGINYESTNDQKTAEGIFSHKLFEAGSSKTTTSDSLGYQNMLLRGVLDSVIFSKKSSKVTQDKYIAHFSENSKSLSECASFKNCMAEFDKQRDDPKNKAADKKLIESKKYAFENIIMSFFAEDMAEMTNDEFKKDLDARVDAVIKEQEKSKAEGIAMQSADAYRREKSNLTRDEILAGESESEKRKNEADTIHYLLNKQISASNLMELATRINENYQARLKSALQSKTGVLGDTTGKEKKGGQFSQTEVRQRKVERESLMRSSREEVTKDFLKSHKQTSRQEKIPAFKRYISKHDGGDNEAVQDVVAEFFVEHDVDPASKEKKRKFDNIEKSAVDEKLIEELKKGSDDIVARKESVQISEDEDNDESAILEERLAEIEAKTQEAGSTKNNIKDAKKEAKAEQKAEKKEAKQEIKVENKAVRSVKQNKEIINQIVKKVGEIHRLLTVSFEKIDLNEKYVAWALSSITMKYGDNLTALSGNELVAAVYTLASEFRAKVEVFDDFLKLENLAKEDEETFLEYKDRAQFLSIELSAMNKDDFNKVCQKEIIDFSLYCNSYKISKEQVISFSKKYAENEIEIDENQKNKAILSLIKILRGRIASGAISDVTVLESVVIKELSDRTAFNLLTQSGYTVEGVNSDDKKTNEHLIYSRIDKLAFENFLSKGGGKAKEFYDSLSQRDKAVFFAILGNSSMWPHISQSNTASTQAISEFAVGGADEMQTNMVIYAYANGEEVAYNPRDYTFAIDALLKSGVFVDEKVNDKVFDSLVRILDGLRAARRAHRGVNSEVMDYSQEQVIEMVRKKASSKIDQDEESKSEEDKLLDTAKSVSDETTFSDYITALAEQTRKQYVKQTSKPFIPGILDIKEAVESPIMLSNIHKLQGMVKNKDENQKLMILIGILQNRSIVDTDKRGGSLWIELQDTYEKLLTMQKFYANAPGREEFIERFSLIDNSAINELLEDNDIWRNAALSLISYQVSSYNELEDAESIKEEDIVGAGRFYTLDTDLLKGAFVLLDSVMEKMNVNHVRGMVSENVVVKEAKPLFNEYKNEENTPPTFDEFIISQSNGEGLKSADIDYKWAVRGYMILLPQEKELVMAVLEDRTMLDLTKEGIGKERFGWTEEARQQINADDRSDLMQEYVKRGRVTINTNTSRKAILSLLTSQIDDVKSTVDNIKSSQRRTIVDWKLFNRAIEFLTLCQTARKNYEERRALEKALFGGVSTTGYEEDVDLYSSNQQKSGNRVSRIGGRTAKEIGLSFIPDEIRNAIGKIGFLLTTNPDAANKFAEYGIFTDDAQGEIDAAREEEVEKGTQKNGAEFTQEMIEKTMSKGQMTIFDMAKDSVKEAVLEKIAGVMDTENLAENAVELGGKIAVKAGADEDAVDTGMGRANDLISAGKDVAAVWKMSRATKQSKEVANSEGLKNAIGTGADAAGADAKLALAANQDAFKSLETGMSFSKSARIQNIVSSAISFLSSFVDMGNIVDPSGLLDKLVAGGFTAINALINGIINYCTSRKNAKDFIRIDDFDDKITKIADFPNSGISPEKRDEYKNMKDDDKKLIWMSMHGMDMNDTIDYVGKEVVYALKFSVSKSCKLPYLRAMGVLIFATLGFTVAGGEVLADNKEIFDKLLGSR